MELHFDLASLVHDRLQKVMSEIERVQYLQSSVISHFSKQDFMESSLKDTKKSASGRAVTVAGS